MSTILIVRDNIIRSGDRVLLEHQAIIGITRSVLANYSQEIGGMSMSEHRMLVPAHLDILPLLAIAADDYTELIEPEPEKINKPSPFILYRDELNEQQMNDGLIQNFLQPRWFGFDSLRNNLQDSVYEYRPDVCVLLSISQETIENLKRLDYRFKHLITFFSLQSARDQKYDSGDIADRVTVADQQFESAVINSIRKLDLPLNNSESFGFWSSMYGKEERLPDIEPFVAFGAAFEMAVFLGNQSIETL